MCDLEFDHSRAHKAKSKGRLGRSIYDFLLVSNNKHMSVTTYLLSHFTPISYHWPKISDPTPFQWAQKRFLARTKPIGGIV